MSHPLIESGYTVSGRGFNLNEDTETKVVNRTGSATEVGQVVMLDVAHSATETTTATPQEDGSVLRNVVAPATDELNIGWFGVCQEVAADNELVSIRMAGLLRVLMNKASGGVSIGEQCIAQNNLPAVVAGGTTGGAKVIAIAQEAVADGDIGAGASNDLLVLAYFDGRGGFAFVNTTS